MSMSSSSSQKSAGSGWWCYQGLSMSEAITLGCAFLALALCFNRRPNNKGGSSGDGSSSSRSRRPSRSSRGRNVSGAFGAAGRSAPASRSPGSCGTDSERGQGGDGAGGGASGARSPKDGMASVHDGGGVSSRVGHGLQPWAPASHGPE